MSPGILMYALSRLQIGQRKQRECFLVLLVTSRFPQHSFAGHFAGSWLPHIPWDGSNISLTVSVSEVLCRYMKRTEALCVNTVLMNPSDSWFHMVLFVLAKRLNKSRTKGTKAVRKIALSSPCDVMPIAKENVRLGNFPNDEQELRWLWGHLPTNKVHDHFMMFLVSYSSAVGHQEQALNTGCVM